MRKTALRRMQKAPGTRPAGSPHGAGQKHPPACKAEAPALHSAGEQAILAALGLVNRDRPQARAGTVDQKFFTVCKLSPSGKVSTDARRSRGYPFVSLPSARSNKPLDVAEDVADCELYEKVP
jgi:hypothetical protein